MILLNEKLYFVKVNPFIFYGIVTVQPTASLLLKSGPFKVCLQQRAGFLQFIVVCK